MAQDRTRKWWTRDEDHGTIVLVEDGAGGIHVAEIPDPGPVWDAGS